MWGTIGTGGLLGLLAIAGMARGAVPVVAAESVYGSIVEEVAGNAASVTSILRNPAQDPHLFEVNPSAARAVAGARLVIENGAGYDPWMARLVAGSPVAGRIVLDAGALAGVPAGANPHLWCSPAVMRVVVDAVAAALTGIAPARTVDFAAGRARVSRSLDAVDARVAALRAKFGGQAVVETEPVFGPMLLALGLRVRDARFGLAVMNDTEPRASDVAAIEADLRDHAVVALVFNRQVSDGATQRLVGLARASGIRVVGVSETLPAGQDYAGWMLSELGALETALAP